MVDAGLGSIVFLTRGPNMESGSGDGVRVL
jgi:hypothetical protein